MKMKHVLMLGICALMLMGCSGGARSAGDPFKFLSDLGVNVNEDLILGDSLTLNDIYCGDKGQSSSELPGVELSREQYEALIVPAGRDFISEMSLWQLLGVRDVGGDITLAAYYTGNNMGYCVYLLTHDSQGKVLDALNVREMHLVWRVNLSDINDNNAFTLDTRLTFEDRNRLTLHRVMGRCMMDFDKDLKTGTQWQQGWNQTYTIDNKGRFVLHGQRVENENGAVDQYAAMDFKTWDLLVCSRHDDGVMDLWNEYADLVNETYDPDYKYNPFAWDVAQLYHMNPQRFLKWMAAKGEAGNRLLPYFKLPPDQRPDLIGEIGSLDDPAARQWLTGIVNSWDDKPLTKHL